MVADYPANDATSVIMFGFDGYDMANGSSGREVARFSHTGNFGIGTTTPTAKLHVNGTGLFAGDVNMYDATGDSSHSTWTDEDLAQGTIYKGLSASFYITSDDDIDISAAGTCNVNSDLNLPTGDLYLPAAGSIYFGADRLYTDGAGGLFLENN